jgi:hypothetical protein
VIACLALVVLGAFGLGVALGRFLRRAELSDARAAIEMWRALCTELHAENGQLRCESTPVPSSAEPPSGAPNVLRALRTRLGFARGEVAQALGIPVPDVETLEHTRFELLEVGAVERFVGALGCRLDVVAQHVDGAAHWLSDARAAASRRLPPSVRLKIVTGPIVEGQSGHNWEITALDGRFLAAGWAPGSESDAREAALQALEELGSEGGAS